MRTLLVSFYISVHCIASSLLTAEAQSTNSDILLSTETGPATTNGIYGIACLRSLETFSHKLTVDVLVACTNSSEFYGEPLPDEQTVLRTFQKIVPDNMLYFAPTNDFCGPMELRDKSGKIITQLKPEVLSLDSYPLQFALSEAKKNKVSPSSQVPTPIAYSKVRLVRIPLRDYFPLQTAGDYTLTVWPKIYKRASTNSDICNRIDLAPVILTFHFDGE